MSQTQADPPQPTPPEAVYSRQDVALRAADLWMIIDNVVYDLGKWQYEHPGGQKILVGVAGTDASKKYRKYHGDNILRRYGAELRIGTLRVEEQEAKPESKSFFSRFRRK